jgi:hypothetical protein
MDDVDHATQDDAKRREVSALSAAASDPLEAALALALVRAAETGRFDVVALLAREVEARRLARSGSVVALDVQARSRGGVARPRSGC